MRASIDPSDLECLFKIFQTTFSRHCRHGSRTFYFRVDSNWPGANACLSIVSTVESTSTLKGVTFRFPAHTLYVR